MIMSAQTEPWPRPHRLTVEDYYRMAEAGVLSPDDRTELIEGEIIDMPPIGPTHASVVALLTKHLVDSLGNHASVRVQLPVRFAPRSEPQPDFAVVKHAPDNYRRAHPVAGDALLLIEVSESTLRYDLDTKARLYATHGIEEYWVVDLAARTVWRHRRPSGGTYSDVEQVGAGGLALPGNMGEVLLADLF
jgi:Uma2 family endonuclease